MPYLRCRSCGRDELYSPKRFERCGCPECAGDLAFDRVLSHHDHPPVRPAPMEWRLSRTSADRMSVTEGVQPCAVRKGA